MTGGGSTYETFQDKLDPESNQEVTEGESTNLGDLVPSEPLGAVSRRLSMIGQVTESLLSSYRRSVLSVYMGDGNERDDFEYEPLVEVEGDEETEAGNGEGDALLAGPQHVLAGGQGGTGELLLSTSLNPSKSVNASRRSSRIMLASTLPEPVVLEGLPEVEEEHAEAAAAAAVVEETGAASEGGQIDPHTGQPFAMEGQSSVAQTIFNSSNMMLGVGLLSLPFAVNQVGWVVGISTIFALAAMTFITAGFLCKCLDFYSKPSQRLFSYSDIGEAAFGRTGRRLITLVFFLECFTSACAYLILCGDTLHALFGGAQSYYSIDFFKLIAFIVVLPSTWSNNMAILSYGSILGLFGTLFLYCTVIGQGLGKFESPGSLYHLAAGTSLWPVSVSAIPLAFGPVMYCYSGHAVIPGLYRDMKEPVKFKRVLIITYSFVTLLFLLIAVIGYFMFGCSIREEITLNLAAIPEYNAGLTAFALGLIVLNPLTKIALVLSPVSHQVEQQVASYGVLQGRSVSAKTAARILIRSIIGVAALLVAVYYPTFTDMLNIIGVLFSFLVCTIFPCACYLKLYWKRGISPLEIFYCAVILIVSAGVVVVGTFYSVMGWTSLSRMGL